MEQENIIGTQIGIYQVLYLSDKKTKDGHKLYHVKCSICNWEGDMLLTHIPRAKVCTHIGRDKHYINRSIEWNEKSLSKIFSGMKSRCYNPNDKSYRWYGAKGIKICDEWLKEPLSFEKWALENGYENGLTIDRKDEDKDYRPENCRWITNSENSKYKSTTRILEVDGISHTGREWPKFLNLGISTINLMLRKYPEEQVKEFIRRRLKDKTKTRYSPKTWMNIYGLE